MKADYRVRTQIRECLEINFLKHQSQPFAAHIAFQLAFCYQIGFGVKSNDDTCHMWLGKSAKQPDDLRSEREVVQPARSKMGGYDEFVSVNLIHEYRTQGLKTLGQAREECERVIDDMAPVFGELHFILLNLYGTWGNLLDELGELSKSKLLRMRIKKQIEETNGMDHLYYIPSIINVARSHMKLGEWMQAQLLQEEALKSAGVTDIWAVELIKHDLASTFLNQGRFKEAEELFAQIVETLKGVIGQEHPDTLTSMASLASTYRTKGRWNEAEELFVQVMETFKRVLGQEHPSALTSMAHLASTYRDQGRWKETEGLEVQVMETSLRVLGREHPDTLASMANLALTFWNQGRWKEAEELFVQVVETFKRVLGQKHPSTLTSMANLASTFWNQGRCKEAEELFVQVMETRKRVLGQEHPSTLNSIANLALTFWNQGRWKEAEELFVQVVETRKRVLGRDHPSTLTSMTNLATTYMSQGRRTEAKGLQIEAVNQLRTTLGEDHPSTVTAIANLASFHEERTPPAPFCGANDLIELLRDRIL